MPGGGPQKDPPGCWKTFRCSGKGLAKLLSEAFTDTMAKALAKAFTHAPATVLCCRGFLNQFG